MTHAYCKNGKLSHVEPFHYIFPDKHTRKLDELPKYHKEPVWALFHYDMRDPLDHQALVEYIKITVTRYGYSGVYKIAVTRYGYSGVYKIAVT